MEQLNNSLNRIMNSCANELFHSQSESFSQVCGINMFEIYQIDQDTNAKVNL